jgi:hypothetical protein
VSVPPEALQQLMAGGGGPPGMGAPQPPAGPGAAPTGVPASPEGQKMAGLPKIEIAMKMMMAALPDFGVRSDEGGAIYDCLQKLQKIFGADRSEELVPAELQTLMQGMGPSQAMQQMAGGQPPQGM